MTDIKRVNFEPESFPKGSRLGNKYKPIYNKVVYNTLSAAEQSARDEVPSFTTLSRERWACVHEGAGRRQLSDTTLG